MKALAVTPSLGALTPDPSPRGRGEDSLLPREKVADAVGRMRAGRMRA